MSDTWKTSKTELCPGLWKREDKFISNFLGRTVSFPLNFGFHPWSSALLPLSAVQLKLEARQRHPGSLPSPFFCCSSSEPAHSTTSSGSVSQFDFRVSLPTESSVYPLHTMSALSGQNALQGSGWMVFYCFPSSLKSLTVTLNPRVPSSLTSSTK